MKVKVCGMRDPGNLRKLLALQPDYAGFIFYPASQRYVGDDFEMPDLNFTAQKVGVFVNEKVPVIQRLFRQHRLDLVQLHGDESPAFCAALAEAGLPVVKAFGIDAHFDFGVLKKYRPHCRFFLFDTRTAAYGGSGRKFNWRLLKNYDNALPIFLSGGIGPNDASELQETEGLDIHAVDINSRFETAPGIKDTGKVERFIHKIRSTSAA